MEWQEVAAALSNLAPVSAQRRRRRSGAGTYSSRSRAEHLPAGATHCFCQLSIESGEHSIFAQSQIQISGVVGRQPMLAHKGHHKVTTGGRRRIVGRDLQTGQPVQVVDDLSFCYNAAPLACKQSTLDRTGSEYRRAQP